MLKQIEDAIQLKFQARLSKRFLVVDSIRLPEKLNYRRRWEHVPFFACLIEPSKGNAEYWFRYFEHNSNCLIH